MRILHILDHSIPLHSGYTFRTLAILREQRALGWETYHLTSAKQGSFNGLEEEVDGWHFFRTPPSNDRLGKISVLGPLTVTHGLTQRLYKVAEQVRPDVLHAHSPVPNALAALRVGRKMHIPVVYEVRAFWEDAAVDHGTSRAWGIRYRFSRGLETYALREADAITTICDGLRRDILARRIPPDKVTVIPNAVDIESFSAGKQPDEALKRQLGLKGSRVLGFIGSFYAYEGLSLLLHAMLKILVTAADIRLLLVGGGPQEASLKDLVVRLGLQDRVVFTGRVPHADIQRYYDLIDILVYPRLKMRLTDLVTPLKPLEAMAQGRLIIASDVGGHRELIRDGETGVLFKAGDVDSLAAKVLELLSERERSTLLSVAARRFVHAERNWTASVARYIDVYTRLVSERGQFSSLPAGKDALS
jgi:PEP-CTERM/exosortase A-associated glycosyltransferase